MARFDEWEVESKITTMTMTQILSGLIDSIENPVVGNLSALANDRPKLIGTSTYGNIPDNYLLKLAGLSLKDKATHEILTTQKNDFTELEGDIIPYFKQALKELIRSRLSHYNGYAFNDFAMIPESLIICELPTLTTYWQSKTITKYKHFLNLVRHEESKVKLR